MYRTDEEIGARIAELLGEREQTDLATAVGMRPDALSKVISGRRGLSGTELVLIARELDVSPEDLLSADLSKPVFMMRASGDVEAIRSAMEHCSELVDGYLRLEALVPTVR
jgi:hypothetical protein